MGLKEFFDYQCDKKQQKCILNNNTFLICDAIFLEV
jgi:hypothetical protein